MKDVTINFEIKNDEEIEVVSKIADIIAGRDATIKIITNKDED
jgi:hypothetical protein